MRFSVTVSTTLGGADPPVVVCTVLVISLTTGSGDALRNLAIDTMPEIAAPMAAVFIIIIGCSMLKSWGSTRAGPNPEAIAALKLEIPALNRPRSHPQRSNCDAFVSNGGILVISPFS